VTPLRPAQAGGSQAFVCDLAWGLAGRGHQVKLYCAAGSDLVGVELEMVEVPAEVASALVRPFEAEPGQAVPALRAGFEELFGRLRADRPDVVSQHAFDAEAFELAAGLPVLHTLHLPPLVPAVVAAAVASGSALATVSEACRRAWAEAGAAEVRVLRNGVPEFQTGGGPVAPVGLIAGRISPEKGIAEAIVCARQNGLSPLVVGPVYDRDYLEAEISPLLGPGELRPALRRLELWELMARSAVAILAVRWEEPFGLVAAEAQVAGCPVAAYARGALPEVVAEGAGGFLARPDDVGDLAGAIRRCLRLDRARIREQARERLLIDRSLDAYEEALR
jgi:glycosyltransferase involved in cell wall biosynthesis